MGFGPSGFGLFAWRGRSFYFSADISTFTADKEWSTSFQVQRHRRRHAPLTIFPFTPSLTPHPMQLSELSAELEDKYSGAHPELCSLKDALHVPSIIHSTILRTAVQPSDPEEKRLVEGLADLGARWEPATVKVGAMSLVHEKHPYMHLRREGGEKHCYSLPSR